MAVTEKSFYHLEHEGTAHYFCGSKCKGRFAARLNLRPGHAGVPLAAAGAPAQAHHLPWGWLSLAGVLALGGVYLALE